MKGIIAAVNRDWVIGKDGSIPWHYPEDLKRFKRITSNSTVIMGRWTYESLGGPLPDRRNIVVTSSHPGTLDRCDKAVDFLDAVEMSKGENVWFIGGAQIYREALEFADIIKLTWVPDRIDTQSGDLVYFPNRSAWFCRGFRPLIPKTGPTGLIFQDFIRNN